MLPRGVPKVAETDARSADAHMGQRSICLRLRSKFALRPPTPDLPRSDLAERQRANNSIMLSATITATRIHIDGRVGVDSTGVFGTPSMSHAAS